MLDFQKFQGEAVIEAADAAASYWSSIDSSNSYISNKRKVVQQQREGAEPCSVLDSRRSPSPPTSTSTLSSSLGGGRGGGGRGRGGGGGGGSTDSAGVAAVSDNQQPTNKWQPNCNNSSAEGGEKEEWASELQPIAASGGLGGGLDDWEAIISESAVAGPGSPTHEQTFLRWIMGGDVDVDDPKQQQQQQQQLPAPPPSADFEPFGAMVDPGFGGTFDSSPSVSVVPPPPSVPNPFGSKSPVSANLPIFYQEAVEEKPHHLFGGNSHGLLINQQQQLHPPPNPGFFLPLPPQQQLETGYLIIPPHPKRHHSMPPQSFPNPAAAAAAVTYSVQQRPPPKPKDEAAASAVAQQQMLVDQLLKAAELVEAGNSFSAREILARLNHILPASPVGLKPLLRSAFLFKDILGVLANSPGSILPAPPSNPWDVVLKLSSYKAFSEVSPLIHFTNFTCTQTLLEEVGGADRIHIVDFDIGVGSQWSSFMQELAHRRPTSTPFLRITAFVSPSAFHPLELHLTRDNLSHFAAELNIPFDFSFLSIESFNPNDVLAVSANEAIAVNLPIGSHYAQSFPTLLRLVKQLNPKIVVSVDQGCDRSDLPFSHHFLHSFQACMVLLDSVDAAGTNADVANKIERFLVQPRVESAVLGRHRAVEKMPPWRALFASVGFVPCQFSNFTETQAECLLKRVQVRGFHVEKRQASLFLYWQRGELGSVSAWKC